MYISIQNKKTRDFGQTEFAKICQENFLLLHIKILKIHNLGHSLGYILFFDNFFDPSPLVG